MLEKPDLQDTYLLSRLQEEYNLQISYLDFLPIGADVNTAVYRAVSMNGTIYFLKLRKGPFNEITVTVPIFLKAQGIQQIIAPFGTHTGRHWADLNPYKMILYPFVEGKNGYEVSLTPRQWFDFGAALKAIHSIQVSQELRQLIPQETFSAHWRTQVKIFQTQVEGTSFDDPTAAKLAAFIRAWQSKISHLFVRAEELAFRLQARGLEMVLCHSDMHAGNLLLGEDDALYIVDWDNPLFAPKERDLALLGGCPTWNSHLAEELFYQGYGVAEIDRMALAYFRYERIIQDITAYCEQLLLTDEGGEDREQSFKYCTGQFLAGHEVDLAIQADTFMEG